jgi:uncharacterized phage protein (TIGR01671 family)
MREIKFRAWNRTHNYMQDFNSHKSGILYSCGSFDVSSGYDSLDEPTFEDDTSEEWAIMQFTGLQDNSGVDIYEGDIVESDYYLPDFTEKAEVRYELHDNFGRFGFASGEQDAFCYGNLTVIGNIHENKELLCED